jgi:glycosyltransferase involved in cell wall biosynthesis
VKILFIHNRYQNAGGEDVAVQLEINILNQFGHATEVLYFDNTRIAGIPGKIKSGINSFYNLSSRKKVSAAIDEFKPDVVHVHNVFFQASPSVLFAAHQRGIPVVMTLHNYRLICANAMLLKDNKPCIECIHQKIPLSGIKNACYRDSVIESVLTTAVTSVHKFTNCWTGKVSKYIALTEFAKNIFLNSSLEVTDHQITVKPNFVLDNGTGLETRHDFFLYVGRFSNEKGIGHLLEAFAELKTQNLFLVGEGPLEYPLRKQYESYSNITFLGKKTRSEVVDLMKQTRALMFPSIWYEGLPYTIIEAFSTATPVLASNLGAMSRMIVDGYNGLFFEPANVGDIIETVQRFNRSANNFLYMNARKTYIENYHPDKHYSAIINLYESLISKEKRNTE